MKYSKNKIILAAIIFLSNCLGMETAEQTQSNKPESQTMSAENNKQQTKRYCGNCIETNANGNCYIPWLVKLSCSKINTGQNCCDKYCCNENGCCCGCGPSQTCINESCEKIKCYGCDCESEDSNSDDYWS